MEAPESQNSKSYRRYSVFANDDTFKNYTKHELYDEYEIDDMHGMRELPIVSAQLKHLDQN